MPPAIAITLATLAGQIGIVLCERGTRIIAPEVTKMIGETATKELIESLSIRRLAKGILEVMRTPRVQSSSDGESNSC